MGNLNPVCLCQNTSSVGFDELLQTLEKLRRQCPALKEIFLPENSWDKFKQVDQFGGRSLDGTEHRSIIILALEREYLHKITLPIHRFVLDVQVIHPRVKRSYTNDLGEKWLLEVDPTERHKQFKIYMGKLIEFVFAEWLEDQSYRILNLEAWGGKSDISASKDNTHYNFEVKNISQENEEFENFYIKSEGTNQVFSYSPYVASNYLLLRVYEAAKQLENSQTNGEKVATIIIDSLTCYRFQIQLKDNWINWWENPKFFEDPTWTEFIRSNKILDKYPELESELGEVLKKLSLILILESREFELKEIKTFQNL